MIGTGGSDGVDFLTSPRPPVPLEDFSPRPLPPVDDCSPLPRPLDCSPLPLPPEDGAYSPLPLLSPLPPEDGVYSPLPLPPEDGVYSPLPLLSPLPPEPLPPLEGLPPVLLSSVNDCLKPRPQ